MAQRPVFLVAFALVLVAVSAIPVKFIERDEVINKPAGPHCKLYNTSAECIDDKCCNWCGAPLAPDGSGFCMKMIPFDVPALKCEKETSWCQGLTTETACDGANKDSCVWMPLGGPAGEGVCIYDWSSCKAPEKVEIKLEAPTEVPPAPKPKLTCNATTAVECDGQPCCNWCGTVWNATSPGFCMPVMDEPIPSMMCSKQGKSCGDMITADMCAQDVICTWIPFGPPGTAGPGICTFDWAKC